MDIQTMQNKAQEEQAILTFLEQTKNGQYAPIDKTAQNYARIEAQTDESYSDEFYFYSIS